jgi:hypothetical protein
MTQRNRLYPERRQHIRIVTLRNFAWFTMAFLLVFAAISLRSELRGRHMHDYGRLTPQQVITEHVEHKSIEPVQEAAPSAPVEPLTPPVMAEQSSVITSAPAQTIAPPMAARGNGRVAIVGGPEGVSIVQRDQRRPMLKGGFGRP